MGTRTPARRGMELQETPRRREGPHRADVVVDTHGRAGAQGDEAARGVGRALDLVHELRQLCVRPSTEQDLHVSAPREEEERLSERGCDEGRKRRGRREGAMEAGRGGVGERGS